MNHKKLIYSGTAILIASILIGTLGVFWFIHNSFESLRTNQTAGIGAVGASIEYAIVSSVFGIIGILTGLIFIIVGAVKARNQNNLQN
jgi:hypothetical protein